MSASVTSASLRSSARQIQVGSVGAEHHLPKLARRYHVHSALLIYMFVSLLIAIGAFNSQNNLLYWLFGLAMGLILVSGLISGVMLMRVRITREIIDDTTVGEPLRVRYRVRSSSRLVPIFALTISELPDAPKRGARLASSTEQIGSVDTPAEVFVSYVPPGGEIVVEAVARATKRGWLRSRGFHAVTAFPFGIIRKSLEYADPGACVIRPAPASLPPAVESSRRSLSRSSAAASAFAGPGDEFMGLREYVPGDSQRSIAWKRTARAGSGHGSELLVRQYAMPKPHRTWILLRLDSPHSAAVRERAIALAAGVVQWAQASGRELGLLVPALGVCLHASRGERATSAALRALALIPSGSDTLRPLGGHQPPPLPASEAASAIVIHTGDGADAGRARVGSVIDATAEPEARA